MAQTSPHAWHFIRAGGFDQVLIRNGADFAALDQLDEKLWAAVSCPVKGLFFDTRTLELIDTDKDGRIRVPEVIAAAKWACSMLKNADRLIDQSDTLPLDQISDTTPEGKQIQASARQILANLGQADAQGISVADATDTVRIFAQTKFNGDGIIPAASAEDPCVQNVITDCINLYGGAPDRSGRPGIDSARLNSFFADLESYAAWWAAAEKDPAQLLPFAEKTLDAHKAIQAVEVKIDDYFARARLAAYDARAEIALNRQESEYLAIAAKDLSIDVGEVAGFPLAKVTASRPLPLKNGINPAWVAPLRRFSELAAGPVLGDRDELTEEDWKSIRLRLAPFAAWQASKKGAAVEKLGIERIRGILASSARKEIEQLIAQDKALEPEALAIAAVEKLARFYRDLALFVRNYVNFRDFYNPETRAVFQMGRLYMDQRACDLCVTVEDAGKHATMAPLSRLYLAYCDLTRRGGTEKMQIAAAFTGGDSDNLMVGRNGLFYDRKGQDWDATITKVIENPISIRQAFWSPYKKLIRWIEEQVAKRAAAADAASNQKLTGAASTAMESAGTGTAPAVKPKMEIGTIAALGVAVGGITAAMGILVQAFLGLGYLMPLGMLGLIFVISGPSMLIAWLKLRQRNLGPLLDANGWAVNTRARINTPFGASLTSVARLPAGSHRDLRDPYAESRRAQTWFIIIALFIIALTGLWYFGAIERAFPGLLPHSPWMAQPVAPEPATAP